MRKILPFAFIAILLGFVFIAFQFYIGPQKTMQSIVSAVEEKDIQKLNSAIDFPMLRENIKSQIRSELLKEAKGELEMAGMMLGMGLAEGFIDQIITAEGIMIIVDSADMNGEVEKDAIEVEFLSLKEAKIKASNDELLSDEKVELILERRGLSWVVVGIEFSEFSEFIE